MSTSQSEKNRSRYGDIYHLTKLSLAAAAVAVLLLSCHWSVNAPTGTAELRVTISQDSIQALQIAEGTELFVHIIEADRFVQLYAEADDVPEVVIPNGTIEAPPDAKRLRADQLGISYQSYSRVAAGEIDILQGSRFVWSFGRGLQPGGEGQSVTFRNLQPDTDYIVYAIQGERFQEETFDPETEQLVEEVLFFGEYYGVPDTVIRLDARERGAQTIELRPSTDEGYGVFFEQFGFLPYEPPFPPSPDPDDVLGEFSGVLYSGAGSATVALDGDPTEVSFDRGAIIRFPVEMEGEPYTVFFLDFFREDVTDGNGDFDIVLSLIEAGDVLEPSRASYSLDLEANLTGFPSAGSIFELEIWSGEAEYILLAEPQPTLTNAGFNRAPSAGGPFELTLSGTFAEDFTEELVNITVDAFNFSFDEVIETFDGDEFEFEEPISVDPVYNVTMQGTVTVGEDPIELAQEVGRALPQ